MKMMTQAFKLTLAGAAFVALGVAHADGKQALEHFLRTVQSAQGQFTQVVTNPPKQGEQVGRKKTSSGQFAIARPNKFRFHYLKPYEQLLVSDGQTLWVYDADLNQLTQKKLGDIMNGSAMAVLAGISLKDLEQSFVLSEVAKSDGLEWVRAVARDKDSSFAAIELGFRKGDAFGLATLVVTDKFGQISEMRLSQIETRPLDHKMFSYGKGQSQR
jgi:outer membrane lipoprotein carrier protein